MGNWNTCTLEIDPKNNVWNFSEIVQTMLRDQGISEDQIQSIVPFQRQGNQFQVIVLYRLKSNLELAR